MQYALIDPNKRLTALEYLDSPEYWQYPEGFTLIEAPDFVPDGQHEYADYVYRNGELVLDTESAE